MRVTFALSRMRCVAGEVSSRISTMARAPFQVLVFPFRLVADGYAYAIFRRRDAGYWQGIAGGGEDDESPLEAARREAEEEAGIPRRSGFLALDSVGRAPVTCIAPAVRASWPADLTELPIHAYGVDAAGIELRLSAEHTEFAWCPIDEACRRLRWDSDRAALRELHARLRP
jgi:dATP pyrophosphohydrolase